MTTEELSPDEIPDARSAPTEASSRWPSVLITIATVITVLAATTTWVHAQAFDTDEWVDLSGQLLDEPEIRAAVATFLVDSLYEELDVAAEVEGLLPEDLEGIAELLAGVLRGPATEAAERLLGSEPVRKTWQTVNREAHATAVAILRDDTGPLVSTSGGSVTLDLGDLMVEVGTRIGLSASLLSELPDDAGQVVIFESDELDVVQQTVRLLDMLSWFLLVLVVGLYALAVYLTPTGQRLQTLRSAGLSLMLAGVVVLVLRAIAIRILVDALVTDPADRSLAVIGADVSTALLGQIAWTAIIYGSIVVVVALLLGTGPIAAATRRAIAPALNGSAAATAAATAVLILLLIWWSPGRAFQTWASGLLIVALTIGAVVALRRAIMAEHPDLTFADQWAAIWSAGRSHDADPIESLDAT